MMNHHFGGWLPEVIFSWAALHLHKSFKESLLGCGSFPVLYIFVSHQTTPSVERIDIKKNVADMALCLGARPLTITLLL